jgi:hypothetical protein
MNILLTKPNPNSRSENVADTAEAALKNRVSVLTHALGYLRNVTPDQPLQTAATKANIELSVPQTQHASFGPAPNDMIKPAAITASTAPGALTDLERIRNTVANEAVGTMKGKQGVSEASF